MVAVTSSKPEESMETLSEEIVVVVLGPIAAELLRSTDDKLLEAANDACEADEAEAMAMAEADDGGVLIVRST